MPANSRWDLIRRLRVNTIGSPDDEHRGARNMYRNGINLYEKRIVYRDCLFLPNVPTKATSLHNQEDSNLQKAHML